MDQVDHPKHYNQGNIECIEAMQAAYGNQVADFCIMNAFKYIWRCQHKDSCIQDLKKAHWYVEKAIEILTLAEDKKESPLELLKEKLIDF